MSITPPIRHSDHYTLSHYIITAISLLIGVIFFGTLGYCVIEEWSVLDALFMTIITITTIGFREVHPLSEGGKVFTIVLALAGVGTVAYTLSGVVSLVVSGNLSRTLRGRHMARDIKNYTDHVILCGCGRMGSVALQELLLNDKKVVVIEQDKDICDTLHAREIPTICDDATREDVLEMARVRHATGLITCLPDDADNVYVSLTAREMSAHVSIVARATDKSAESKLRRAGATHVVLANDVAGHHMTNVLLQPDVISFIDTITGLHERKVGLREIAITAGCTWENTTSSDQHIREKTGLNILAVRRSDGELVVNPSPEYVMQAGDVLIAFGPVDAAAEITARFASQSHGS